MSDEGLRGQERRWRSSGDPAEEARVLQERVRAGALAREALGLAAYLGHAPAQVALGAPPPLAPILQQFVYGLEPWGREAWTRAALAAAERVLPLFLEAFPEASAVADWPVQIRAWLAGGPAPPEEPDWWLPDRAVPAQAEEAFLALAELRRAAQWRDVGLAGGVVRRAADALGDDVAGSEVRAAIQAALVPWALGTEGAARGG